MTPRPLLRRRRDTPTAHPPLRGRPPLPALADELDRLGEALRGATSLETALASAVEAAARVTGSVQAAIRLLDKGGRRLLLASRYGPAMHRTGAGRFGAREGFLGAALGSGRALVSNRPARDPRFQRRAGQEWMPSALLAVPLLSRAGPIGVLSAARHGGRGYGPDDLARARLLAGLVASHVEVARLERLSATDDLTLLFNARHLKRRLPEAVRSARASRRPLSLVAIDLDGLGEVNDTHLHDVGDEVLVEVAARLREGCRAGDLLGRKGGDEFLAILPDAGLRAARIVAERLRACVRRAPVATRAASIPMTASFGVATLGPDEEADALLRRADQALYRAKEGGRDRVACARRESLRASPGPARRDPPARVRVRSPRRPR